MTLSTVKEPIIMDNEILNNEEEEETSILTLTDENGVRLCILRIFARRYRNEK